MILHPECGHCPLAGDARPCKGQNNPRWCVLSDPASPEHRPELATPDRLVLAPPSPAPVLLSPAELARQRSAESCPHRDCVGCGCSGCRCRPEGRRAGQVVTVADCLACVDAAAVAALRARDP